MPHFPDGLRQNAPEILARCISSFEAFYDVVDVAYRRRVVHFNPTTATTGHVFEYFGDVFWFLNGIYLTKYRELLGGAIQAVADQEFLVFALCGRALLENTATLKYHNAQIQKVVTEAQNPDAFTEAELKSIVSILDTHSRGGRFDWSEFFSTPNRKGMAEKLVSARKGKQSPPTGGDSYPRQISAQTAIDRWAKDEPWIALSYEFFCELVHPNLGSNFLVVGTDKQGLGAAGSIVKDVGQSICVEGIKLLAPALREASVQMMMLIGWAGTSKREPT